MERDDPTHDMDFPPLSLAEMLALDIQALINEGRSMLTYSEILEAIKPYIEKAKRGEEPFVSPPVTQVDHLTAEEIPLMLHQLLRSDYAEAVIAHIADLQTKQATVEGAKDILDGELKLAFDKYAEAQEQIERMRTALMQIRACVDKRTIAFKISNTALQEPIP